MWLFNCEATFNNFQEVFVTTGKSQMLYLSIKKVTSNCCKIIVQFHCCQFVVKFPRELTSTQCLNFLNKIISVHANLDFVHLAHVRASYYWLFMTSMLVLIKILPLKWEQIFQIHPKHLIKYGMRGCYSSLSIVEYQEIS